MVSLFSGQNQQGQFFEQKLCRSQEVERHRKWEEQMEKEEEMKEMEER